MSEVNKIEMTEEEKAECEGGLSFPAKFLVFMALLSMVGIMILVGSAAIFFVWANAGLWGLKIGGMIALGPLVLAVFCTIIFWGVTRKRFKR